MFSMFIFSTSQHDGSRRQVCSIALSGSQDTPVLGRGHSWSQGGSKTFHSHQWRLCILWSLQTRLFIHMIYLHKVQWNNLYMSNTTCVLIANDTKVDNIGSLHAIAISWCLSAVLAGWTRQPRWVMRGLVWGWKSRKGRELCLHLSTFVQ